MRKILLIFGLCVALFSVANAQLTITGNVIDEDGIGIPGASIMLKGTTKGTITSVDGKYTISVPNDGVLVFSFVGMTTVEEPVNGRSTINVTMVSGTIGINEVVVTALGIEREAKALGYAATKVGGEELVQVNTISPVSALQGKAAGLSISGSDGGLFGSTKIEIRGISTLNSQNNQPIFVIDGVILENAIGNVGHHDWSGDANDFGNMLKNLNVENYESINVLKGAAATALYGSRGINGAIIIKTKDGKGVKGFGVTVTQTTSVDHVYGQPDFQMVKGRGNYYGNRTYLPGGAYEQGFITTKIDGKDVPTLIGNTGRMFGPAYDANIMIEDYDGKLIPYVPVDNFFAKMYDLGWGTNTNVAFRGSDEKGSFYLSTGYNKRSGTSPNNEFTKTSLFFSGNRKLADFLTVNASVSVTGSNAGNPPINLGEQVITNTAWNMMYDADKWKKSEVYQAPHGGTPSSSYGDQYAFVPGNNVWFSANLNEQSRKETLVMPIVRITADVTDWMQVIAEGNVNYYTIFGETKILGQGYQNEGGEYRLEHMNDVSKTAKLSMVFDKVTGDFSHNLLLHGELWNQTKSQTGVRTDGGLIVPGQFFIANSKKTQQLLNNNIFDTKQINSLLFRYSVDWRQQLYLDVTGRNDWSSALVYTNGEGNYSYYYPSVSTSWLFSDTFEENMPSWVSFGKLRASWAQVGNDTSPFIINRGYSTGNIEHANGNIITNYQDNTVVDTALKPERKTSVEFGLTLNTFGNRLNLDAAWYSDVIENQIGDIPLPAASGYSAMLTNIGTLQNQGLEITLVGKPIQSKNFRWNSTFNYWKNVTTVKEMHELTGDFKNLYGTAAYGNYRVAAVAFEGGEYGILYSDSEVATDSQGRYLMSWHDGVKAPYFKRDGSVKEVGKIQPDFEGSWENEFQYKNLTASFLLDMRFGGDVISFPARYGTAYGYLETSLNAGLTEDKYLVAKGVTWTSKYSKNGTQYTNGVIPNGVFDSGTVITTPSGTKQDVSGLTYVEAAEKGYVDPAVDEGSWAYWHSSWGTGVVNPNWLYKLSYIALRNINLGYNVNLSKYKIQNLAVNLNVRDAGYLYNSSPNNLHPEAGRGSGSAQSAFHRTLLPYSRTYTLGLQVTF